MDLTVQTDWTPIANVMKQGAETRHRRKTPKRAVKKRKGKGGQIFSYVKRGYVKERLNKDFPGWSFTIEPTGVFIHLETKSVTVLGNLRVIDEGVPRTISDVGGSEIKIYTDSSNVGLPLSLPNDIKAARTDCLKRCASNLGIAEDIYDLSDDDDEVDPELIDQIKRILSIDLFSDIEQKRILDDITEGTSTEAEALIKKLNKYIKDNTNVE